MKAVLDVGAARLPTADASSGRICMAETTTSPQGVVIRGAMKPGYEKMLTPEAVAFAVELERKFGAGRRRHGSWQCPRSSA